MKLQIINRQNLHKSLSSTDPQYTLCIDGCQFKILLYAFKLAQLTSFEVKIPLKYQLKNEVSWANFNIYQRIFNWQPFMHRVYVMFHSFSGSGFDSIICKPGYSTAGCDTNITLFSNTMYKILFTVEPLPELVN